MAEEPPGKPTGPDLQGLREAIEAIDRDLLATLRRRMELVEKIAQAKLDAASPFRDQQREEQVLQRVRGMAVESRLDAHAVERLYRLIMEMSISHQQAHVHSLDDVPLRVTYQGVEGAYSHLAARQRYSGRRGGALLSGHDTFRGAVEAVHKGTADVALLPIENSTAGSINETYDLLAEGDLRINAELINRIDHCLLGIPGTRLEDLRRVISHPQALRQCDGFLRGLPWVRSEAEFDTAGAARKVKQRNDKTLAAIASHTAAEMLGLEILAENIQPPSGNFTRFVEVAREASPCPPEAHCKTSLLLVLDERNASLGEILVQFSRRDISLCKLESRPLPDSPWSYRFYIDVEAHADRPEMTSALEAVAPLTREIHLLGTYPRAE